LYCEDINVKTLTETSGVYTVTLKSSVLTANRILELPDLNGVLGMSGANPFNQSLNTTDNVNFLSLETPTLKISNGSDVVFTSAPILSNVNLTMPSSDGQLALVSQIPIISANIVESALPIVADKIVVGFNGTREVKDSGYDVNQSVSTTSNVIFNSVEAPTIKVASGLFDASLSVVAPLSGNTSLTLPITSGQIALTSDITEQATRQNSTGVYTGGQVTVNVDNTKFDISAGTGCFVDINGVVNNVSWSSFTAQTVPLVGIITYIGLDSNLAIVSQPTKWTPTQHRTILQLGILVHVNGVNINTTNQEQQTMLQVGNQLHDYMDFIGSFNIGGNTATTSITLPASLKFSVSSGSICVYGANFINDPLNPHRIGLGAIDTNIGAPNDVFQYRMRNGTSSALTLTSIIPNILDNGTNYPGTTYSNGSFGVNRIYRFTSGVIKIQPPQFSYSSMDLAWAGLQSESFIVEPSIANNGILIGYLNVRGGTTLLNNTTDAQFRQVVKFSSGAIGSALNPFNQSLNTTDSPSFVNMTATDTATALKVAVITPQDTTYIRENTIGGGNELNGVYAYTNSFNQHVFQGNELNIDSSNIGGNSSLVFSVPSFSSNLLQPTTLTANRTWTLPNQTGTVAMTSDIPVVPPNIVTSTGVIASNRIVVGDVGGDRSVKDSTYDIDQSVLTTSNTVFNTVSVADIYKLSGSTFLSRRNAGCVYLGLSAGSLQAGTGVANTIMGEFALQAGLDGSCDFNTLLGNTVLPTLTSGIENVMVGASAGFSMLTGSNNTFLGTYSGQNLLGGTDNILVGRLSGDAYNASQSNNILIGNQGTVSDSGVIRIGDLQTDTHLSGVTHSAKIDATTEYQLNTAKFIHITGTSNTFLGINSGNGVLTNTISNTAVGTSSLTALTGSSVDNCAFGTGSLTALTNGSTNTAIGSASLNNLTDGSGIIAIGRLAGSDYTSTESNNICIGNNGILGESDVIRIGTNQSDCYIAGSLRIDNDIYNKQSSNLNIYPSTLSTGQLIVNSDIGYAITAKNIADPNKSANMGYNTGSNRMHVYGFDEGLVDGLDVQIGWASFTSNLFVNGSVDLTSGSQYKINGSNKLSATHLNAVNQFPSISGQLAVVGAQARIVLSNNSLNGYTQLQGGSPTYISLSLIADALIGADNFSALNDGTHYYSLRYDGTFNQYFHITYSADLSIDTASEIALISIQINGVKQAQTRVSLNNADQKHVSISCVAQVAPANQIRVLFDNLTLATSLTSYGSNISVSLMGNFLK
jgi:hypothetical protein